MSEEYKVGSRGEGVRLLQKGLNEKLNYRLVTDGVFGRVTADALKVYQKKNGLPETGIYDKATQAALASYIDKRFLDTADLDKLATKHGLPADMLKAIRHVEGRSDGFLPDGRCLILFERHQFHKHLAARKGAAAATQAARKEPDICNRSAGGYQGGTREHARLERARKYDVTAADMSASWGMFQIMGFNHKAAGYKDVASFVKAMNESEDNHLVAVINFIKSNPNLLKAVKAKDCARTAYYFNGSGYRKNRYDERLAEALKRFA